MNAVRAREIATQNRETSKKNLRSDIDAMISRAACAGLFKTSVVLEKFSLPRDVIDEIVGELRSLGFNASCGMDTHFYPWSVDVRWDEVKE